MKNRKLLVKPDAATEVRRIFSRYLELESVPALVDEMKRSGASRNEAGADLARSSGQPLAPVPSIRTGKFYYLLSNPIYVGKIRHADELYEGNHQPIIEQATFDRAQELLAKQAPRPKGSTVQLDTHLLNGLLFDESGDRLSPIHAKKDGKRYRYYISSRLNGAKRNGTDGWRLPALELENIVVHQLQAILADRVTLARWIGEHASRQDVQTGLAKADLAVRSIKNEELDRLRAFLRTAFRRITVSQDTIAFEIDHAAICRLDDRTIGSGHLRLQGAEANSIASTGLNRRAFKINDLHPDLPQAPGH